MRLTTRDKMGLARVVQRPVLAARRARGLGPVARVRRRHLAWELDLREGIDFAIWLLGAFEPSTVRAYRRELRPGATVLDVGANVGAHTLPLAAAVGPTGRVLAFEPTAPAFERLATNVGLNPALAPRIDIHQVMLLATDEAEVPAAVVSSWPLLRRRELDAIAPGRPQGTEGARAATLDAVLGAAGVDRVELVKLDVDGFECDVLDGAVATIGAHHPVILCELAPSQVASTGRSVDDLVARLRDHGYRLWDLEGRHEVTAADVAELRRQRASTNVIAR